MSWVSRLIAHFPMFRVHPLEVAKRRNAKRVVRKADDLLDDYKRQDKALLVLTVKKR